MLTLAEIINRGGAIEGARAFPRATVDRTAWASAGEALAAARFSLSALWGEAGAVNMAVREEESGTLGVLTLPCPEGSFPSIGRIHAPAIRLERAIRDVWGLAPEGAVDGRPWLDHGKWSGEATGSTYDFLPAEGEHLHQVAVGPVHAGAIEPGHFRFTASGETVVRLEERFGYVHKGTEKLMAGADLSTGLTLAERISGDSSLAYGLAFCRSVEAARGIKVPPRAEWLRALALEMERIANHFGDFGGICNDAAFALLLAHCSIVREDILRAAEKAFGARLMRDFVVPGGVSMQPDAAALAAISRLTREMERRLDLLNETYEETSSLQDRTVTTGRVSAALANRFAAGGFVGRASGRAFDARKAYPFAPYDRLDFEVSTFDEGDVDARVRVRIMEIGQSLSLIRQIIDSLPDGEVRGDCQAPLRACEGGAIVEGFRGDIFCWLKLSADGKIDHCHMRDPSWFQWPLLEAAIEGNIIADFPICNKSFNCSYSGHDL